MPDSDLPPMNDPWADLPTPQQAGLTPPPLPSVEIREPVVDTPTPEALENTLPIDVPPAAAAPPASVFTGPPQGLTDPTVAVPPIVAAPDFVAEEPPPPAPEEGADAASAEPPLVDRTDRDSGSVVFAGLGLLIWGGALGAVWWALTRGVDPVADPTMLASPNTTWTAFRELVGTDAFWDNILATSARLLIALFLGGGAGLAFGTLIGQLPRFGRLLRPLPGLLRLGLPAAIFLMLVLARGLQEEVLLIPAALAAFAAVAHTTADAHIGVRSGVLRSKGPAVVAGLRAAVPLMWIIIFLTEAVGASEGVGAAAFQARTFLRSDVIIVWMIVGLLMVLVLDLLLLLIQHLLRPGRRDDVPAPLR